MYMNSTHIQRASQEHLEMRQLRTQVNDEIGLT